MYLKIPKVDIPLILTFYICVMPSFIPILDYKDEFVALLGLLLVLTSLIQQRKMVVHRSVLKIAVPFLIFLFVGLVGNWIYGYQGISSVLKDILTHIKFFLSIVVGFYLFKGKRNDGKCLYAHAKFVSVMFFVLHILDMIFHFFPHYDIRYGIRSAVLMYGHPTYLAATEVFLLSVLLLNRDERNLRQNIIYMCMCIFVLICTFRSKAIGAAGMYLVLYVITLKRKLNWKITIAILIGIGLLIGVPRLLTYYVEASGNAARSVLFETSLRIMKDYFPIGTGFGTYGSFAAAENYSPVYIMYGFRNVYGLSGGENGRHFFNDAFWPIIFGQTGFVGSIFYVTALFNLIRLFIHSPQRSKSVSATILFIFLYLLISSTAETAFNNVISMPLAITLGGILCMQWSPPTESPRSIVGKIGYESNVGKVSHIADL